MSLRQRVCPLSRAFSLVGQSLPEPHRYFRYTGKTIPMPLLLVLEDNPADLRRAVDIARRAGFTEFEVSDRTSESKAYLQKAIKGTVPLPSALVIDLDLGHDSGFELLRFWHSTPSMKPIPVIIWTGTAGLEHEREICGFFGVSKFIRKDDDPNVLREALANILESSAGDTTAHE